MRSFSPEAVAIIALVSRHHNPMEVCAYEVCGSELSSHAVVVLRVVCRDVVSCCARHIVTMLSVQCVRACVRVQAASATRHAETRRSTSVEVEPTTSAADTERPAVSGARSVERLHQEPPAETAATTPLLARLGGGGPERAPRPPPPRRRGDSVTRHGDAGSKDSSSKSSSSNNNNVEPPPPPAAVEATSAAAQYVEFGSRTTTTVTAAVVELAPSEVAAAPPAAEPGEPGPHVYCYTTAPPAPSQAEAEPPVVAEESPRVPPWPRREEPAAGARRPRCRHCDEPFEPAANRRGACPDAPDAAAACVERASCVCCARALVYHCLEPHDGDHDPPVGQTACRPSTDQSGLGLVSIDDLV